MQNSLIVIIGLNDDLHDDNGKEGVVRMLDLFTRMYPFFDAYKILHRLTWSQGFKLNRN